MTLKKRIENLEAQKGFQPMPFDKIVIHSDLPEGEKPTGIIRIIEHDPKEPIAKTGKAERRRYA
jgi:hypothetical protein